MEIPNWETHPSGTRVRVALWLVEEVGEGNSFTKAQLREAFPGVEQIDRRMRDLRKDQWTILTYREDRSLEPDELRLARIGGSVWERGYISPASKGLSDKARQGIFAEFNYCCALCGIAGGEPYPDEAFRSAKLLVTRPDDGPESGICVCERCNTAPAIESFDSLEAELGALSSDDAARLQRWVEAGRRPKNKTEVLWQKFLRLPAEERNKFRDALS